MQKKLSRNLKPAERALMERPEVALRMLASLKSGKREQAMLASCLESGYWLETSLDMDAWRTLVRSAAGGPVAQALVWTLAEDGPGFMIKSTPQGLRATDSAGRPVALPDAGRVRLWHSLAVGEVERAAWQALLVERCLRQPFRQVYREFYLPPTDFSGHVLAVRRLLGLARREGWRIGYDDLLRGFGALRVGFPVNGRLYPGAEGYCVSTGLRFERREGNGWRSCAPGGVAPVVFSEACRAVDLLVSTAGIALDDDGDGGASVPDDLRMLHLQRLSEVKPGRMADLRRRALLRIFAPLIAAGTVAVGERDVRVGDVAVSLSTARVTRGGAPVAAPAGHDGPRLAALPWLPYDEVFLERIVDTVVVLLKGTQSV